jgi:hypothetical protein
MARFFFVERFDFYSNNYEFFFTCTWGKCHWFFVHDPLGAGALSWWILYS